MKTTGKQRHRLRDLDGVLPVDLLHQGDMSAKLVQSLPDFTIVLAILYNGLSICDNVYWMIIHSNHVLSPIVLWRPPKNRPHIYRCLLNCLF